ncbi:MAG: FRG domain-containing protein [Methylococcales bacterium]|nr:FRG domain-containing protein [Methylococcales bacterium]MDD5631364.1 FRG domain-containing protein [Methylococcales bacterium]
MPRPVSFTLDASNVEGHMMLPTYKGNVLHPEMGCLECKVNVLRDFSDILRENNNFQGFLFRGHQFESYKLEPTILRSYKGERVSVEKYQKYVEEHYVNFISSLRGRFNEQYDAGREKNEMWALGQHYGLSTPMLDWTASPWLALYFAFREKRYLRIDAADANDETYNKSDRFSENRSVYFLNANNIIQGYYFQIKHYFLECHDKNSISYPVKSVGEYDAFFLESVKTDLDDSVQKILNVNDGYGEDVVGISEYTKKCCEYAVRKVDNYFPRIVSPKRGFNNRLLSQRGLFTYSPTPDSLEKELMTIWMNMKHEQNYLLLKLLIPDDLRDEILETLYEMNINDLSLFPDIHGACSYANWKSSRKNYR